MEEYNTYALDTNKHNSLDINEYRNDN